MHPSVDRDDHRRAVREAGIRDLVAYLCSPECAGRRTGTPESARARGRIARAWTELGLEPIGPNGFFQPVPASSGTNVLARLPGRGPLAERSILLAAHYDHLGKEPGGQAYLGADDNAAAVAILTDTAAGLARRHKDLGRQIVFSAFDAEEPPFFMSGGMGSMHFVRTRVVPIERIDMMVCMDLMGHALGPPRLPEPIRNAVFVLGAERSHGTRALVDRVAGRARGVNARHLASDVIPALSDYYAFELERVPFLFLTCGRWAHYHLPSDTPEKLDYPKALASSDFLIDLALELSNQPEVPVTYRDDDRANLSTIESIVALAEGLAPLSATAAGVFSSAQGLRRKLGSEGRLGAQDRTLMTMLVLTLEAALQAFQE